MPCETERASLLPHTDDGEAAFADAACKTREIAIAGNDAKPLDRSGVHDVHSIDDHGRIGGIFTRGVTELLNGRDRILKQRIFPFRMQCARPVAIDTLIGDGAVFRQLVGDRLDVLCRNVIGIDDERKSFLR